MVHLVVLLEHRHTGVCCALRVQNQSCGLLLCFCFLLQESTKVSELNPNAKVWGNHMLHLEAGGATDGSVSKAWEEIPEQPPGSCQEGTRKFAAVDREKGNIQNKECRNRSSFRCGCNCSVPVIRRDAF